MTPANVVRLAAQVHMTQKHTLNYMRNWNLRSHCAIYKKKMNEKWRCLLPELRLMIAQKAHLMWVKEHKKYFVSMNYEWFCKTLAKRNCLIDYDRVYFIWMVQTYPDKFCTPAPNARHFHRLRGDRHCRQDDDLSSQTETRLSTTELGGSALP